MPQEYKFGLTKATLLCINTMMGAALFVNPKELTQMAGSFGFSGYVISAVILLPLIFSIAELARLHPVSGGLYVYSKTYLNSGFGFLSGWSYFISKAVASGFLAHVFTLFLKSSIPALTHIPTFFIACLIIFSFVLLNSLGVRAGGRIQYVCTALKIAPILFAFACGYFLFSPEHFTSSQVSLNGLLNIIPLSLYAFAGFEIICAVGGFVHNPEKNIRRAIFIAFFTVAAVYISFSVILYGVVGSDLAISENSLFSLGIKTFPKAPFLGQFFNGFVFASIIGSAFSVFTSNSWNFHSLADNQHLPFSHVLAKVNNVQAPWVSLLVQAVIACLALAISHDQVPLQNMSVLALFISSLLTSLSAYRAVGKNGNEMHLARWIPMLAVLICSYIILLCFGNIVKFGVSRSFLTVFLTGCALALAKGIKDRREQIAHAAQKIVSKKQIKKI